MGVCTFLNAGKRELKQRVMVKLNKMWGGLVVPSFCCGREEPLFGAILKQACYHILARLLPYFSVAFFLSVAGYEEDAVA
jgi:hypothetical protein